MMHGNDLVDAHAFGLAASIMIKGNPKVPKDFKLRLVPKPLGINEQAIHIEDGSPKALKPH